MTGTIDTICLILLGLACAWLVWTDLRDGIIPDWINALIAVLALLRVLISEGVAAAAGAAGAGLLIGAALLLLRHIYFLVRGRQGLGLGDVKFLAAAGLWTGLADFPILLLAATFMALVVAIFLHVAGRSMTARTSLPFGPFLVAGLAITLALQTSGSQILW